MSLRNIEMQIALPRTHDAGKLQEQLNQRSQLAQEQLANSFQKESDIKRSQVQENSDSEKLHLKKESSEQHQQHNQKKRKKEQKQDENPDHPYKGKKIDFFG
ncbi:hypothetical protein [Metabacillus bambusae]|uniref:RNA polymerase subunit sigma n=1 Tax=Metabacillus bambusae TaxID=2795218 RepID=A0ABS3MWI7_9BACI|nr:hypothetical protein [Metabacillus bambusae]MBO1510387.1 hypothetical protein [Metabacillus bambusae]